MTAALRRVSSGLLVLLASALPAYAEEPRLLAGLHLTCDVLAPAQVLGACPGAEAFGRVFVSPHIAVEVAVGYRSVSSTEYGGRHSSSSDLTEYPVVVGASFVFAHGARIRPHLSAGLLVAPYKSSYSSYIYPGPTRSGSSSSVAVGGFGGVGLQWRVGPLWHLDAGLRYVYNPIAQPEARPDHDNYVSATLGLARAF